MSISLDLPFNAIIPYNVQIDPKLCASAKLFYGQICGLSVKHGYMYASNQQLADMTQQPIKTIERWMKELEDYGHLRRETENFITKNEEGKNVWQKRRKVFFNDGFARKPEKETLPKPSNNDYETPKNEGSFETLKNEGSLEPLKNEGNKDASITSISKQQSDSPSAVVVSSLYEIQIEDSLRNKIIAGYSKEDIDVAVERCLKWKSRPNDAVGIMTALRDSDIWVDNETKEEATQSNLEYLSQLAHLDKTKIAGAQICVGNKYIEFSAGMNVKVFNVEDKDFKTLVEAHLKLLRSLERK